METAAKRAVHPLGFDVGHMDFQELWALHDALRTVADVVAGLQCQPRFHQGDDRLPNKAGDLLDQFRDHILCEINDVEDLVATRHAADDQDQSLKFEILAGRMINSLDPIPLQVAEIAKLARQATV